MVKYVFIENRIRNRNEQIVVYEKNLLLKKFIKGFSVLIMGKKQFRQMYENTGDNNSELENKGLLIYNPNNYLRSSSNKS